MSYIEQVKHSKKHVLDDSNKNTQPYQNVHQNLLKVTPKFTPKLTDNGSHGSRVTWLSYCTDG
jgi:hypothetical protein